MTKKIFLIAFVFSCLGLKGWAQPTEITEVDLFSIGKLPTAENVTVYGINIKNSLDEGRLT